MAVAAEQLLVTQMDAPTVNTPALQADLSSVKSADNKLSQDYFQVLLLGSSPRIQAVDQIVQLHQNYYNSTDSLVATIESQTMQQNLSVGNGSSYNSDVVAKLGSMVAAFSEDARKELGD